MKKPSINGVPIPYDAPVSELLQMLNCGNMQKFMLASETLSFRTDRESFEAMKKYITDKDYYKRLYIMEPLFRHPLSEEIIKELENALKSDDLWFVQHALDVIEKYKTAVPDELILSAVKKFRIKLNPYYYQPLNQLDITEKTMKVLLNYIMLKI